jgi:hypothetical protein
VDNRAAGKIKSPLDLFRHLLTSAQSYAQRAFRRSRRISAVTEISRWEFLIAPKFEN